MDADRISTIFAELEKLSVNLPRNAADLGPQYMSEQVSLLRGYSNQCSFYLHELLAERTHLSATLDLKQTTFEIRSDELLSQDSRVKALSSLADRQAMINYIQKDLKADISSLKQELAALVHVEKVIRLRMRELDNTSSDVRTQRNLLRDQLKMGSGYGDESSGPTPEQTKSRQDYETIDGTVSLGFLTDQDFENLDSLDTDLTVHEDLKDLEDKDMVDFFSVDYV